MFVSTIIPTIGRPVLGRAVQSVLEQSFAAEDFEVIVVNDSGRPLPEAEWMHSERVRVLDTNRRERVVARNSGAAVARGRYFHFLDDDDWLLPGALQSLWELSQSSPAAWLYGGTQLVDRANKPEIQLHHGLQGNCFTQVMAGEWIPLPASLVSAEAFFAVEGFSPQALYVEDTDLLRKVALSYDLAETQAVVACLGVGVDGSSTNYQRAPEHGRQAREWILNQPGAFARMRSSAESSFWRGRMLRIYLTSLVWNLQRKRGFTAAGRALWGAASLASAGSALFRPSFWRAIRGHYVSPTFLQGFEAARKASDLPAATLEQT